MRISFSAVASVLVGLQLASATPRGTAARLDARDTSACAAAASASASFAQANPQASHAQIPADIAYNCLTSVTLRKDAAVGLTRALKPYVQLQSTVDYLRNPPPGYLPDAADIPRLLDAIETKLLAKDTYESEYDFQIDIFSAFIRAKDGHTRYQGSLLQEFIWLRPIEFNVVSVSTDGKSIPQIYAVNDIITVNGNSIALQNGWTPSPIKSINGLPDAATFFMAEANADLGQDPDNSWNTRFWRLQDYATNGNVGAFNFPTFYPGPTTTIEFQNGTQITLNNLAVAMKTLQGISTGDDFYQQFGTGQFNSSSIFKREVNPLAKRQTSSGPYPQPIYQDNNAVVAGYYLDKTNVAVLTVYSFEPGQTTKDDLDSFQDTVTKFFADAVKNGKTQLVIDLQGNGGGSIDLAIDLAAQLFPTVPPNSKENMRASYGMHSIMLAASNYATAASHLDAQDDAVIDYTVVPFAYQDVMTPDVKNFGRLQDYYGPLHVGTGFFTNFFQGNYTNDAPSQFGIPGVVITGFNERKGFKQPFTADNIIMFTDGYCASACTIFSEHMKLQGVQVITMGGRLQTGPMQAVGGVKGSQVFEADNLDIMLQLFNNKTLNTDYSGATGTPFEYFSSVPLVSSGGQISINGRNQFRIGDDTQTPLQFVYEAADCRIYQTPEMLTDPTVIWSTVASLAFSNRKNGVITSDYCVTNSTQHPTSISGGLQTGSIGPQTPPANAKPTVKGFLINGTNLTTTLASGEVSDSSPVAASVTAEDGNSVAATSPDVLAAVDTMNSICKGYTGQEWFVQLLCGAFKQTGGSS